MKKVYKKISMLIMMSIGVSVSLCAQNLHLLDINDSKDSHPSNNSLFNSAQPLPNDYLYGKFEYAVLNNIAYFTADDGIHGAELWRSDGTAKGTYMVKDINSGNVSSGVSSIIVSGNKIFFRADDGIYGQELWVSDGTESGTFMIKDISPFGGSVPSFLTDVNGTLYFFTNYYSTADELWKTDGTTEGTIMVSDFLSEFGTYNASQLTNVNGRLFFVLDNYGAPELYTSDGNFGGTYMVKDINPFGGSNPTQLTPVRGILYFAADDATGRQLWVSDGTDAGTYKANNPNNISVDNYYGTTFTIKNSNIYFSGYIPDGDGSRLCTYNTSNTSNNIKVVKNINPGYNNSNLYNITNVNGILFFTVFNGLDQVLWKSDGTAAGTMQVADINPGGRNIYLYKDFINANGALLFSFYDDAHGYEVWKSDGTEAGTVMVKEINHGVYSSQAANITYIGNNTSFFEATNGKKGLELWKTDGTEAGTALIKDINISTTGSSNPSLLIANTDKSKLLFVADEPKYGTELRITDGTDAGTHVVKDLLKGSFSSYSFSPVNFNNETWFFADILNTADHSSSDVRTMKRFCKTDGTLEHTKILSIPSLDSAINGNQYVSAVEAASNLLYILLYNSSTSFYELWRTNGTETGTYAVKTDILSYYAINLKAADSLLFFTAYDNTYGYELFVTDGSISSVKLVKDIAPGYNNSNPSNLTSFKGKLYFTADYGYGPFVWSSDGTEGGTNQVKPAIISYSPFAQANDKLFFSGVKNVGKGNELYATDGTVNGTYLVKDVFHGPGSSNIYNLTGADTLVYFTADDGKHGTELWKSNGTSKGTHLVKDITPDIGGSYLNNLVTVHNELFFLINGLLWQSDGTQKGTHITDDVSLANISNLSNLTAFDNQLAFTAFAPATGQELYIINAGTGTLASNKLADVSAIKSNITSFNAMVYPNPAHANAAVEITGNAKNIAVTITDASGKIVWQNMYNDQLKINLPVEKLTAGMYMITVRSINESKTIKLIKQ